jgi:chemotaxis protein methyltransferase CheR
MSPHIATPPAPAFAFAEPSPTAGEPGAAPMTPAEFARVRALIHERAGIHLHDGKHAMVTSRLGRRLRDTGHASVGRYLGWLEGLAGAAAEAEWQQFVNCLTTNLTAFFREPHHFDELAQLLRSGWNAAGPGAPLRLWCNAASTGEEPYSLAMTLAECQPPGGPPAPLLASDIDTAVLAIASAGIYGADARGLSPERLKRHFLRGTGANAGFVRVRPEVARLVRFMPFNLIGGDWTALGEPFSIVFCRNVMIYFDAATQRRVLEGMHRAMCRGGLLFAGHSENFADSRDLFRLRGRTVYERL